MYASSVVSGRKATMAEPLPSQAIVGYVQDLSSAEAHIVEDLGLDLLVAEEDHCSTIRDARRWD